jgi:hypothetical protein
MDQRRTLPWMPFPEHADAFIRSIVKPDQPMRVSVVALALGVHPHTVKRIPSEQLAYFRVGTRGDRRYLARDVKAYIDRRAER